MARVVLEGVGKTYEGSVDAVRDFNLAIADGEFIVFVGPSGCGKSTTLRMVAGLEEISKGTITIGDRVVNDVHPKDRDIAMVFQNYALYPHMTVYKNMAFALQLRKVPKQEIDRRVREAASMLGIESYLSRKPKALSGGQRQRVALGRAIVREPAAFLFDEPLSNLDAKLRVTTRGELKALHQRLRTTTIYVTHDQEEAMTLGDRVVVMAMGEMQQAGSPLEIYRHPVNRFVAGFVGMPPMNFLDGRIEGHGEDLFWVQDADHPESLRIRVHPSHLDRVARAQGRPVVLGLRPQAISEALSDEAREAAVREGRAFAARVGVVELLGEEMDLRLSIAGEKDLTARVRSHETADRNATRMFVLDTSVVQYFEPGEFGPSLLDS